MEEIIRHIHMEMLQAHCDDQSYIDDYMFLTEIWRMCSRKTGMSNWKFF